MKLADKQTHFIQRGDLPSSRIKPEDLKELGITRRHELLAQIMFERGVSLASPFVLSSTGRAFVGAYSYMNSGGYLRERTFIGRYCSIGRRVTIGAARDDPR